MTPVPRPVPDPWKLPASISSGTKAVPSFAVVSGGQVQSALKGRERQIVELVEATYRLHNAGGSVNPPSYFLLFPDRPSSRIIALPASINGQILRRWREVDFKLPGERESRRPESLGGADPERSRHGLPVRLHGSLDYQRHEDSGVRRCCSRLVEPRPPEADSRRLLRSRPDCAIYPRLLGRHGLVV